MARQHRSGPGVSSLSQQLFDRDDLVVDRIYEGGRAGHAGDDRISKLVGTSNQGGFRYLGSIANLKLAVLISSFADLDWPDALDRETGLLTYFGDNKTPGTQLLETPRGGNKILDRLFAMAHSGAEARRRMPPIFVFGSTGTYRDVQFLGLAVPGAASLTSNEDLVAIWRSSREQRFQNYRATFTILDAPVISRIWLDEILRGRAFVPEAPTAWLEWVKGSRYRPLAAKPTAAWRTRTQQLPQDADGKRVLEEIRAFFCDRPAEFEHCAAALIRLMDDRFDEIVVTRPSRDGGRDAIGTYRIGEGVASIRMEFAIEAKCYAENNAIGVKETSRLISRLRHRQFGVLVTTSYLAEQAYRELIEDEHPVLIVAARDIAKCLVSRGLGTTETLLPWLNALSTARVRSHRDDPGPRSMSSEPSQNVAENC